VRPEFARFFVSKEQVVKLGRPSLETSHMPCDPAARRDGHRCTKDCLLRLMAYFQQDWLAHAAPIAERLAAAMGVPVKTSTTATPLPLTFCAFLMASVLAWTSVRPHEHPISVSPSESMIDGGPSRTQPCCSTGVQRSADAEAAFRHVPIHSASRKFFSS
jgi:hypothetical protein